MGLFNNKDLVPTFGDEFSNENKDAEFESQVWNTELVDDLIEKVENHGLDLNKIKHPFFEKDINLRRARIAFQLSDFELSEFKKCRKDIVYFANTYVKLMQEHGIDNIKLYPYQVEMLKMYVNEKYSLVLGSRQIGKCINFNTHIDLLKEKVKVYKLYFRNLKEKTIFDKIKYSLYWCYSKLEN